LRNCPLHTHTKREEAAEGRRRASVATRGAVRRAAMLYLSPTFKGIPQQAQLDSRAAVAHVPPSSRPSAARRRRRTRSRRRAGLRQHPRRTLDGAERSRRRFPHARRRRHTASASRRAGARRRQTRAVAAQMGPTPSAWAVPRTMRRTIVERRVRVTFTHAERALGMSVSRALRSRTAPGWARPRHAPGWHAQAVCGRGTSRGGLVPRDGIVLGHIYPGPESLTSYPGPP